MLNIVLMLLLKCQIFMDTWCHIYTWGLLSFFSILEHFWQMMIWEIDWPQCSPREIERYTCCSSREIMRTIHNYLSLKWHEIDAAVKPEVFMASTHLFIPYEAEIFMNGYIIQTYLSQFWCLFWNAKYCSDAFSETLNIVLTLLLMVIYLVSPIYLLFMLK